MTDSAGTLKDRRILIVEDETMIAMLLEEMLADLGCIVVGPARDVAMALEAVNTEQIDCAILDLNLRGERADPVADALVARGVPFIFATGYGESGIDPRFKNAPVLQKPYEFAKLTRTLIETAAP
jgi:CheY-like chemotaxis protein